MSSEDEAPQKPRPAQGPLQGGGRRAAIGSAQRARRAVLAGAACVLLAAGGLLLTTAADRRAAAPPALADSPEASSAKAPNPDPSKRRTTSTTSPPSVSPLAHSAPVEVSIPAIHVRSRLERLGLDRDKAMQTPQDPARAGWYHPGPAPGEKGPAVIAGHVTWNGERAVFFDVARLTAGDRIDVVRKDGATARFAVERIAQYPKAEFPTIEVYRNLDHAGLRLITCAGDYSAADGRYADNIVVFARLVSRQS
ncbi:class F sortase [Streptomyces aureocirculatus]|uniref:class F sortase n=1 Tax=Streptomyces aureocirculatus TaxID=67275 RepID=UPI001CED2721|nr:class F sortase [Streptomyces aureocirculatus]